MLASILGIIPYSGVELMVYSYLTVPSPLFRDA